MEKAKRIEARFHLPEDIIQHIQSFLNKKEAAQTTLLSKSWHKVWSTQPNLDFDYEDFKRKFHMEDHVNKFCKFVEKTVERYDELNLKIHSLRLWTYGDSNPNHYIYYFIEKWIVKALRMGVTCLDLKIYNQSHAFGLPYEVFESKNLITLSVSGCKVGFGADEKVSCSRLKSLNLEGDTIWDIISSCPLIEDFSLCASNKFTLSPHTGVAKQNAGAVTDSPFNKMKCLLLHRIDVDSLFFEDLSSKFPCLKDLSLNCCGGYNELKIYSPSLECVSFVHDKMLSVKFVVPSICKFTFSGSYIPSVSFENTTSYWESDILIKCSRSPSANWILSLNKLLTKLSLSKVSLSLVIMRRPRLRFDIVNFIQGLGKPKVENLMVNLADPSCHALFDGLFWCCRPIYVIQGLKNNDFMEFVYKRVMQQVSLNSCIANQSMPGECDLEGVDVEFFDESVSTWQPRLVDASTSLGADGHIIRLHLRWGH